MYDDHRLVEYNESIRGSLANAPAFLLDPRTIDEDNCRGSTGP